MCIHIFMNVCVGVCEHVYSSKICAARRHSIRLACTACSRCALFAHRRREKPSIYITNRIEKLKKRDLQREREREKEERNTEWGEGQEKERDRELLQLSFFPAIWEAQRKIGDEYGRSSSHSFSPSLSLFSPFLFHSFSFIVSPVHSSSPLFGHFIPHFFLISYFTPLF